MLLRAVLLCGVVTLCRVRALLVAARSILLGARTLCFCSLFRHRGLQVVWSSSVSLIPSFCSAAGVDPSAA
jgi:hypothetical protein